MVRADDLVRYVSGLGSGIPLVEINIISEPVAIAAPFGSMKFGRPSKSEIAEAKKYKLTPSQLREIRAMIG